MLQNVNCGQQSLVVRRTESTAFARMHAVGKVNENERSAFSLISIKMNPKDPVGHIPQCGIHTTLCFQSCFTAACSFAYSSLFQSSPLPILPELSMLCYKYKGMGWSFNVGREN